MLETITVDFVRPSESLFSFAHSLDSACPLVFVVFPNMFGWGGGGGRIKGWKNTGNLSLVFVSSLQSYLSGTPFITKICQEP